MKSALLANNCKTLYFIRNGNHNNRLGLPFYKVPQAVNHNDYLKTRYSLLLTVHPNPGPPSRVDNDRDTNDCINLITYNVNGLGSEHKTKLLVNKLIKYNKKQFPTIIALQETHLTYESIRSFNNKWRFQATHSCYTSASAGVSILYFGHQWAEVIDEGTDVEGRICSVVLRTHSNDKYAFLSVYVPSSNSRSLQFVDTLEAYCTDLNTAHPGVRLVLLGDFNYTNNDKDYTIRTVSPIETALRLKMNLILQTFNLKDSYRVVHPSGGFTWGHKNSSITRSRIDRIFTPTELQISEAEVVTDFGQSDHSLLMTRMVCVTNRPRGPGYYKINPCLLENPCIKAEIELEISTLIDEAPNHFNPHLKWDYVKLGIRGIFMKICARENKSNKFELECAETELNLLHAKLQSLLAAGAIELDPSICLTKLEIKRCEALVIKQRELEAKNLIYLSRAQWAEEGEKSTKYFLNLIKTKSADSTIHSIKIDSDNEVTDQRLIEREYVKD